MKRIKISDITISKLMKLHTTSFISSCITFTDKYRQYRTEWRQLLKLDQLVPRIHTITIIAGLRYCAKSPSEE